MRRFPFTKLAEFTRGEKLDEVQTRLLQELDQYLNQIATKDDLSERSLKGVHEVLATLIDWQTRTLRGRAMMRRRILKQIQQRELQTNHYEQGCADLMLNDKAQALLDQWVADKQAEKRAKALQQPAEDAPESDTSLTDLTDAIDAWLLTVATDGEL